MIKPLDAATIELVKDSADCAGAIAQHHPVWLEVLAACGEQPSGVAAFRDGQLAGWMMSSSLGSSLGTAVTALPFITYGAPASVDRDQGAADELYAWFLDDSEQRSAAAMCIGLSPLSDLHQVQIARQKLQEDAAGAFVFENFSQVQSLTPHPIKQVSRRRGEALARFINRAEREDVNVGPCTSLSTFKAWLDIYRARYAQLGARPLPDNFHLEAFSRGGSAGVVEFWAAERRGRLLGGTLFLVGTKAVDYFSSAFHTDEETRTLAPNHLLLSRAFDAFAARGRQIFNWQSSPGREGVYRYKAGWGAKEVPQFYIGRVFADVAHALLSVTPAELSDTFPNRFVLPFSMLRTGV
jgi:hypothetical protein